MRIVLFFVYLCFHLLGGGNSLHADTQHNHIAFSLTSTLVKNEQVKITNTNQAVTFIEDVDLNLEEEHFKDDVKDGISNNFFDRNYTLLDRWYLTFSGQSVLKHFHKDFKIFAPFCGQSNPIYITLRVLRI
jgi:hypothetical protein